MPPRPALQIIGYWTNADHYRLRDFLTRIAQPYAWVEAGSAEADRLLAERGLAEADLPVVIEGDEAHTATTVEDLARAWGALKPPSRSRYDFAVIGSGPA